ncbi:uncharacterized protein K452DRAFT_16696 [Aplosporella prunicola CBS 121167]|uniref:Uncharacterized protein n=1 Tax=Aplosporella prunicola CBS 121167 TaxID=1176127 RepID=A0A6A6AW33_9PEZI|nr:uncharacterized protein K452DRAFT_16696 [Aplosporella prunicola CBS 121167]KAF2135458.1 hypothetical protein K452DRAFT_16696 [Aplosporella prunicola CBS 121167]
MPCSGVFDDVTVHTAKCSICNRRNISTLKKCIDCGQQVCRLCYVEKNGTHGLDLFNLSTPRSQLASVGRPAVSQASTMGAAIDASSASLLGLSTNASATSRDQSTTEADTEAINSDEREEPDVATVPSLVRRWLCFEEAKDRLALHLPGSRDKLCQYLQSEADKEYRRMSEEERALAHSLRPPNETQGSFTAAQPTELSGVMPTQIQAIQAQVGITSYAESDTESGKQMRHYDTPSARVDSDNGE